MISQIDKKYFKLCVQDLKKDSNNELSACCPLCGDTKNRLHMVYVQEGDYSYVKCFNSGCSCEEPTGIYNLIQSARPDLTHLYKQESFKKNLNKVQEDLNIQSILNEVKTKKPKEPARTNEKEIPLHKLFLKAQDIPECVEYLENRNIQVQDDWYYSKEKFFTYNDKSVYLLDYLLIPIYNKDMKYRGFYSRSIKEKRFSTFLLPDTEKVWILDPTKPPDIITEAIFDGISSGFDNPGAMLGSDVSQEYRNHLPKDTIFAFDNDQTGYDKTKKYLNLGFRCYIPVDTGFKDFNEMLEVYNKTEIKNIILNNTYSGLMGTIKLGILEK